MKIGHTTPINRIAAQVTQRGTDYTPNKKIQTKESKTPFRVRQPNSYEMSHTQFVNLTGTQYARFTVLGMAADHKGWVCRCTCGTYCIRSSRAIKNPNNQQDRCEECRHLAYLKRNDHYRQTGKDRDIKDF